MVVTFTNLPPCFVLESSLDLNLWYPQARLERLGSTNQWHGLNWTYDPAKAQFWRVKPCP